MTVPKAWELEMLGYIAQELETGRITRVRPEDKCLLGHRSVAMIATAAPGWYSPAGTQTLLKQLRSIELFYEAGLIADYNPRDANRMALTEARWTAHKVAAALKGTP